ncbi:ABC transporter permease [Compostibacter hankyongensis]|uniref:ABC transporter permease n=1 Tax=Compostibacter hankyongensis TaxID=1007089 RepID=A0ABP8FCC1_9BACT
MIKNYLKTAIRNLSRYKGNAVINIAGLMVGFAAFLLIFLLVQYEKSFDSFHRNRSAIYRVVRIGKNPVNPEYRTGVPFPVTNTLRTDFPQLTKTAAIWADGDVQVNIKAPDGTVLKKFKEPDGVFFAEPQFFQMFDFSLAEGNIRQAINEPYTVLLTKESAIKYFGDWRNVTGKTINMDKVDLKITGILNDPPSNTDFQLKAVVSYATLKNYVDMHNWNRISDDNYCFIQLNTKISREQFDKRLAGFTETYIAPNNPGYRLSLQPLNEMHYDGRYGNFSGRTFSKDLVLALELIGLFLLIIACVNFINITTAQSVTRSREVGVRKVLGGKRTQIVFQFLGETGIITLLSLIGAVIIVLVCIPLLNNLLDIHLSASMLTRAKFIGFMLCVFLSVTFLSGFYPALVLSGFKPGNVLKGSLVTRHQKGISLRRGLVVLQFVIAQALIIGTLVVSSQMNYFRNADLGFRKSAVLNASFPDDSLGLARADFLRNELLNVPGIEAVSFSSAPPSGSGGWYTDLRTLTNYSKEPDMVVAMKPADTNYFNIYRFQLVAGRRYFPSDTIREFVVNEAVVRGLGISDPADAIGKMVNVNGKISPIVGVVKDFHTNSLRDPINAVVMTTIRSEYGLANVKIDMKKATPVIAAMERIWNKDFPDYFFEYNFLDQSIANYYKQENQLSQLYKIFSIIAIFISCLGLYGLISFIAVQRKKEIGIRKVLGAAVRDIVIMLSRELTVLIVAAFLIASPVAWYFMHQWLQQYTYRISIGAGFFVATVLCALCVAWVTVGYTAIRAATANPVKSLRTE